MCVGRGVRAISATPERIDSSCVADEVGVPPPVITITGLFARLKLTAELGARPKVTTLKLTYYLRRRAVH